MLVCTEHFGHLVFQEPLSLLKQPLSLGQRGSCSVYPRLLLETGWIPRTTVPYVNVIHHTRTKKKIPLKVHASLPTESPGFTHLCSFTTQTAAFSLWGKEKGNEGGDEEGNAFIFPSNEAVITKRVAHSARGSQAVNSTHINMHAY